MHQGETMSAAYMLSPRRASVTSSYRATASNVQSYGIQ